MSTFAGKGGYVLVDGNEVAEINDWSLSLSKDMLEDTAMQAGGTEWRTFKAGLKEWSGSWSGFWDLTNTDGQKALHDALVDDSSVDAYFHISGDYYYWGSGQVEAEDAGSVIDDVADISFDIQGSGELHDEF